MAVHAFLPSRSPALGLLFGLGFLLGTWSGVRPLAAQQDAGDWDVTEARGLTYEVDFTTDEGTWMSLDVSPDGRWIVFDLLGHVYRVPTDGGPAESLTQNSGAATNVHPQYSPDGTRIVFVSDRRGQSNPWIMNADGSDPWPIFLDLDTRVVEPTWTPDGRGVVLRQQALGGSTRPSGIVMYTVPVAGADVLAGAGAPESPDASRPLLPPGERAAWPSMSRDGRYLYYQVATRAPDIVKGAYQLRRLELESGQVSEVTTGVDQAQYRGSSGSAIAPEVSPDGRWLAFARRIPDGTISWRGQRIGPRTALFLRDLHSGAERILMDPIELDMGEGIKTLRVLPGYSWAEDGRSIYITQGGRIRRVDVASGAVETVPFTAPVRRTVSEQARARFELTDGPLEVRFPRWHTASPGGDRLLFQAVGRLWVMDLPDGTPHRLTPDDFEPLEYSGAWSPDGAWIAFTSWDDEARGHVWRVRVGSVDGLGTEAELERVTDESGEYLNPVWSPDGGSLVVTRGSGASARGRTWANNPWYELVALPLDGSAPTVLARASTRHDGGAQAGGRRQIVRASFGPEGRVFYPQEAPPDSSSRGTAFVSVRPDGTDRRVHLMFPFADEAAASPDGGWVAYAEGLNVYVAPMTGLAPDDAPRVIDKRVPTDRVRRITLEGGLYPRWTEEGILELGSGRRYFRYDPRTERTDTFHIRLEVPRAIGRGTVALTNARILPMDGADVIERGHVVVRDGRIACVGACETDGVDRVIDAAGTTLMPGIVDPHAHHHREHSGVLPRKNFEAAVYLAYGVTTTMDPIGWSPAVFPEAEMIEAGVTVGPRVFSTGENLSSGDRARSNEIATYEDARHEIHRLVDWGAVAVKQYGQPRRDQRQWIADIGRDLGVMVTGEGSDLVFNVSTTLDGQTGFEHPMSYVPLYGDAARFFGETGTVYSPTFVVGGASAWSEEYFWQVEDQWTDAKQRRWLPWRHLIPHTRRRTLRPETDYTFPFIALGMADVIRHGGYGAIGSHGQHHGIGSHWEMWMIATAMSPMETLEVATMHGARYLGMERDLGSLEPGKIADLVVLNANPLDDIHNTANIRWVMKAGVLYEADTLDEIWPTSRPYGGYPWVDENMLRSDDRPIRPGG
ncbi:MAG: amidohydrolase family protein [Gemmatimonadota bacterium]